MVQFIFTKQTYSKLVGIGTNQGGYICEWDPFSLKIKIPRQRGIHTILVWQTSNLVIFLEKVGDTRCYVWDAEEQKIWDVITTETEIYGISICDSTLMIERKGMIDVYELPTFKKMKEIRMIQSPYAFIKDKDWVGKCVQKGNVIRTTEGNHTAHENAISQLCVERKNENMYMTCSEKGTIIRVWDRKTLKSLWEGRRGLEPARIFSCDFVDTIVIIATKKGSVHMFDITTKGTSGYLWSELPKSKHTWYVGENPVVQIYKENVYIADKTGLITIASIDSGETLFQTSLLGDSNSPFAIPLS